MDLVQQGVAWGWWAEAVAAVPNTSVFINDKSSNTINTDCSAQLRMCHKYLTLKYVMTEYPIAIQQIKRFSKT